MSFDVSQKETDMSWLVLIYYNILFNLTLIWFYRYSNETTVKKQTNKQIAIGIVYLKCFESNQIVKIHFHFTVAS